MRKSVSGYVNPDGSSEGNWIGVDERRRAMRWLRSELIFLTIASGAGIAFWTGFVLLATAVQR